jgi:uncharacterized membrane protein
MNQHKSRTRALRLCLAAMYILGLLAVVLYAILPVHFSWISLLLCLVALVFGFPARTLSRSDV